MCRVGLGRAGSALIPPLLYFSCKVLSVPNVALGSLLVRMPNRSPPPTNQVILIKKSIFMLITRILMFETHVSNSQWDPSLWVDNLLFIQAQDPPCSILLGCLPLLALLCLMIQPSTGAQNTVVCICINGISLWDIFRVVPALEIGPKEELQVVMDQRKRKNMISSHKSTRWSWMRKQKHLDDLRAQVAQLRMENHHIGTNISITIQCGVEGSER
ncbi:hypothetical protein NL676_008989 [Syzygium grande]|nr:hypothetical protein NL676_008989 [Syzygium grande]